MERLQQLGLTALTFRAGGSKWKIESRPEGFIVTGGLDLKPTYAPYRSKPFSSLPEALACLEEGMEKEKQWIEQIRSAGGLNQSVVADEDPWEHA